MGKIFGYLTYSESIKPDIVCVAKAMAAPLPMSAVISTKDLIDTAEKMGGTNAGNPLCCAAALANIDFLTNANFQNGLKRRIRVFEERMKKLESYGIVDYINARGMIGAVIFKNQDDTNNVIIKCINNGVMPVNTWRKAIKIGPPLTITVDALDEAFDVMEQALRDVENDK